MEELITNVNWVAVITGAVVAYALGALWYSPKMFGTKWLQQVGISPDDKGSVLIPMITQGVGTFLFAWVIGITETTDSLLMAVLITLTIMTLIKANGLFARKGRYAIMVEVGYVLAMAIVMILAHALL